MLYLVDVNAPCIFEMIKNKGHGFFTVLSFPGTTVWHCGATHSPQHNWIHQYLFIMRFFFFVLIPKPPLWGHESSTVVFLGDRLVPFKRVQAASRERYEFFRGNIRCNCFISVGKFPSFPSSELFEELRGVEGTADLCLAVLFRERHRGTYYLCENWYCWVCFISATESQRSVCCWRPERGWVE